MNEHRLLEDIALRLIRVETRVRNTQFRTVRIERKGNQIMAAMDDLKASIDKYIADVNQFRQTVQQAIDAAIAADDAGEDVVLADLKKTVDDADAALVTPPVVA